MFLLGSLGAGLAPGPVALIAARAVQAAGAALFYPQVLAVLQTVFAGRARAFAAFGATIGLASIAGNAGLFFVLTLHLQDGLGYSPLTAGLAFVPLAAAFTAASLLGARLGRHTLTLGYGINAAGTPALLATVWAADGAALLGNLGLAVAVLLLLPLLYGRRQPRPAM